MLGINVTITRYISDDPQPGIVECQMIDARGRCWSFIDKVPIFSAAWLDAKSSYPQLGFIACQIVERRNDANGREIVTIDTELPWHVESTTGEVRFDVHAEELTEWTSSN